MRREKHQGCQGGCHGRCCLQVEHLSVRMGEDKILDDVSFHLHCGELIALIGPNGAGKSSLFKSILGVMPYHGSITFQSAEGGRQKPRIGYVPQSPSFDPGDPVSVLDLFVAASSRWPAFLPVPARLRETVLTALERVGGRGLIDRRLGTLSGGELQRVLLAMALEPVPNLLILDEPMSGVDVEGEQQLLDLLDRIRERYDLSILLSTHDFQTLGRVDKVILLQQRILASGDRDAVFASEAFRRLFGADTERGGDGR
ncbi:MAG TPA: metal ABC transporter ATP-binding protein [Candidatus Onthomonas avicola]|nr:metal ABC transporter ATP-binding protein [Candidatus Onthomonas avicola]